MPVLKPLEELDALGRLIRTSRERRRWSQADLAAELGLGQSYVSAVERGDSSIPGQKLALWAHVLDVSLAALAEALAARSSSASSVTPPVA